MIDLNPVLETRRQLLLHEAAQERLAALLPRHARTPGAVRHGLALACYRLAGWLDADRYVRLV